MILVVAMLLVVLSVPLTGGDFGKLRYLRVRGTGFVFAAIGLQLVLTTVASKVLPATLAEGLHLVSYALAVAFLVVNRRITGLWILSLGGGLNLLAIAVNHGVMPATTAALRRAGRDIVTEGFSNSNAVDHARLSFLGDVFAVPKGVPLANVFSAGDVLLVVGIGVILHVACRKPRPVCAETRRMGGLLPKQSSETQTGRGDARLGLGQLDDELGAMGWEDVFAQEHGAAVDVASDAPAT